MSELLIKIILTNEEKSKAPKNNFVSEVIHNNFRCKTSKQNTTEEIQIEINKPKMQVCILKPALSEEQVKPLKMIIQVVLKQNIKLILRFSKICPSNKFLFQ